MRATKALGLSFRVITAGFIFSTLFTLAQNAAIQNAALQDAVVKNAEID